MITVSSKNVGINRILFNQIKNLTSSYIDKGKLAGTVTLVARQNEIIHFQSAGKMNLETGQSMRDDAIFRIYSMTKPVTSLAAMMLYEREHFKLNTPVSTFIPEFKKVTVFESGTLDNYKTTKPLREMQIRDLLTHTSGLSYGSFAQTIIDEMYRQSGINGDQYNDNLESFVTKLSQIPLLFSPGTKWNYGFSHEVLGRIIEVISGKPLDVFLKKNIFDPLGMIDTGFYVPLEKQNRFTINYMHKSVARGENQSNISDQKLLKVDDPITGHYSQPPRKLLGGQGLVSTASDYLKFASMLLNKGLVGKEYLIRPETVNLITANHLESDLADCCIKELNYFQLPGIGYGLGVGIMLDAAKAYLQGTPGLIYWSGIANTSFFIDPKEKLIGIFLTQAMGSDPRESINKFHAAIYQALRDPKDFP